MSDNTTNYIINVTGNANQVIANIGKNVEGLTNTFTNFAAKITMLNQVSEAVNKVSQAFQGLVGSSLEFEQQQANLKTLLNGDTEALGKLTDKIKDYSKSTVYDRSSIIEAQKTMMSFGLQSDFAFSKLKNIGDIALGDANKMKSLALAFSQATSTGKLMGQDLLQMINAGFNPLEVISKKTGQSMTELKDKMSKGEITAQDLAQALEWATEEGGKFYKGAETAADTTAGKIAQVKAKIDDFKISLFEATNGGTAWIAELANMATPVTQMLPLISGLGKVFGKLKTPLTDAYTKLGMYNGYLSVGKVENLGLAKNVIQASIALMRFATVGVFNALKGLGAYILSLVTAGTTSATFATIASTAFGTFATAARTACAAVSTAIASIPIIGWVAIAVTAIGGLLVWLYKKFDKFAAFCSGLWAGIKSLFSDESFSDAYDKAYAAKMAEREEERKKEEEAGGEDPTMKDLINNVNGGIGGTGTAPGTLDNKTTTTATGGTRNTQITINLGKFVENMVFNGGYTENKKEIENHFREMLLRTLYAAQIS
ncbi:MAG: tape measure protein [Bacteroidales bacterium]|nr:tape measure protein [Bacteroidales bacterium]